MSNSHKITVTRRTGDGPIIGSIIGALAVADIDMGLGPKTRGVSQ